MEELSIPAEHIRLLGRSDYLCQPGKFSLQPIPALVDGAGLRAMRPSPAEVAETFTVPLSFFQETPPEVFVYTLEPKIPPDFPYGAVNASPDYRWEAGEAEVPIWRWEGRAIWGLTGRIVKNLLETLGSVPL